MADARVSEGEVKPASKDTTALALAGTDGDDELGPTEPLWRKLLGFRAGHDFWGLGNLDLGLVHGDECSQRACGHDMCVHDGQGHGKNYDIPKRRRNWTDPPQHLTAGWSDLFLDLIFVGAAYQLGDLIKYTFFACTPESSSSSSSSSSSYSSSSSSESMSGSDEASHRRLADYAYPECLPWGLAWLHSVAIFSTMFRLWLLETMYRARFDASDSFHRALDMLGYLLLIVGASNISPLQEYTGKALGGAYQGVPKYASMLVPFLAAALLWWLRYWEVALLARAENARRLASALLIDFSGLLILWSVALAMTQLPEGDVRSVAVPLLMLCGAWWPDMRLMWRVDRRRLLPGPYRPRQQDMPPINVDFVIHRNAEFMFLMLGETVLQLVIQNEERGTWEHYVAMGAGYVVVLAMLYTYHITEPHAAEHHAMRRSAEAGVAYQITYQFKAVSVLLVGVGVKLVLYDPNTTGEFFSDPQRLQLGLACSSSFGLQMLMHPLHTGLRYYYSPKTLAEHPRRAALIVLRLILVCSMTAVALPSQPPYTLLCAEAALGLLQCALIHREMHHTGDDVEEHVAMKEASKRAVGGGGGQPTGHGQSARTSHGAQHGHDEADGGHGEVQLVAHAPRV